MRKKSNKKNTKLDATADGKQVKLRMRVWVYHEKWELSIVNGIDKTNRKPVLFRSENGIIGRRNFDQIYARHPENGLAAKSIAASVNCNI